MKKFKTLISLLNRICDFSDRNIANDVYLTVLRICENSIRWGYVTKDRIVNGIYNRYGFTLTDKQFIYAFKFAHDKAIKEGLYLHLDGRVVFIKAKSVQFAH